MRPARDFPVKDQRTDARACRTRWWATAFRATFGGRPAASLRQGPRARSARRAAGNVRGGQSAVLVIRGEAGIGKTALLRNAARQAAGFRVAQVTGVQAEMELPFAGIHQLCAPVLDRLDAPPAAAARRAECRLGLASGDVPDRFLVGLAVLNLLSAVAEERPLLCLVEDAQWLDAASGQVLGFVARRVLAESVAIVVAVRGAGGRRARLRRPPRASTRRAGTRNMRAPCWRAPSRPTRRSPPRPDHRRDPRQSARSAGAAAAHDLC